MRISFIGDVHGKIQQYEKMLRNRFRGQRTFQLGDMNVGFPSAHGQTSLHKDVMNSGDHKWIRGNHDSPEVARKMTDLGYAGDYGYFEDIGLFFLGGAYSIDKLYRVPGREWWADEELSYPELMKAIDLYVEKKPKIVATHEAPARVAEYMLQVLFPKFRGEKLVCAGSRTAIALQCALDEHRPKEWVFGHYHIDTSFEWRGTKFTCVNELSVYTISDEPLIVLSERMS